MTTRSESRPALFANLRGDVYGGLTAAVVALPLALAFGVASGAGVLAGLYGAIFVGFFAAVFGGTPAQVSGPTGPMTVVMAVLITRFAHDPALAFTVVIMGGAFQILFGLVGIGRYVKLVPYPVVSGSRVASAASSSCCNWPHSSATRRPTAPSWSSWRRCPPCSGHPHGRRSRSVS